MFLVRRVDRRRAEASESLGTKPKFWFTDGDVRLLFKAEERGTGEDWAEKVACHLCELLGLPHVHYELAEEYDGETYIRPGIVCETCVPKGGSLVLGNQLMVERDPNYPAQQSKYRVREHTVAAFASRARSAFYARGGAGHPLGTLEAFSGFARHAPKAARVWVDRLAAIGPDQLAAVLDKIPNRRMSKIAKTFSQELLQENQNRLLSEVKP